MSKEKDNKLMYIMIAYVGSVALCVSMSPVFFVVNMTWTAMLPVGLFGPAILLHEFFYTLLYPRKLSIEQFAFGIANIVAAILTHPRLLLAFDKYKSTADQFYLLRLFHSRAVTDNIKHMSSIATELSHAVQYDTLLRMKLFSPWMFWLHPLSVVLLAWGLFIIFYKSKKDE